MEKEKKWVTILIVGSLITVMALGLVVYNSARAAVNGPYTLVQDDDTEGETQEPAPFFGRGGFRPFGHHGWFGGALDYDSFLADALGISVEDLQAARQTANDAAIDEAVARGYITEEQGQLMKARNALMAYIDKDALLANALGVSVDELQAAREEGKSIGTLIDELGLEAADVRDAMQAGYEDAVQSAVDNGIITQDQADQILSGEGCELGFGGWGMRGGKRGFGGFHFFPKPDTDTNSGSDL